MVDIVVLNEEAVANAKNWRYEERLWKPVGYATTEVGIRGTIKYTACTR